MMESNKEKWMAWIARNPIQAYMSNAEIGTADVAKILLVSRQIVYRWLAGETIPSAEKLRLLEDRGVATVQAYSRWWSENPNPRSTCYKSPIDRERIRELLESKSEVDPITGCKIYCGRWNNKDIGLIRIGRRLYTVQKAAMWVAGKLELYDHTYAYRTCRSPACWASRHIKIAGTVAEGMEVMRRKGIIAPKKRGIYLTDQRRMAVKILLEEGRRAEDIAIDTGVNVALIRRVEREMEVAACR